MAESNADYIEDWLLKNTQFSAAGIAGLMGNWEVESTFSPVAHNPRENAWGLAQWENGRLIALQDYAQKLGKPYTDTDVQLSFAMQEMKDKYPSVWQYLQTTTDPSAAAAYVDQNYEVSSGSMRQQRISDANAIQSDIYQNKPIDIGNSAGDTNMTPTAQFTSQTTSGGGGGNSILGTLTTILGGALSPAGSILGGFSAIEKFFGYLTWIFNLDHFMKFLLYTWGGIFVLIGIMLVIFATGKNGVSAQ